MLKSINFDFVVIVLFCFLLFLEGTQTKFVVNDDGFMQVFVRGDKGREFNFR